MKVRIILICLLCFLSVLVLIFRSLSRRLQAEIDEHKKTESELVASEERLRTLINANAGHCLLQGCRRQVA